MASQEPRTGIASSFSSDDVRLIAQIGFTALSCGDLTAARRIFDGLAILRPGSEASIFAEASYQLMSGDPHRAIEILRGAEPTDQLSTMLAISLFTVRQAEEGRAVLEEIAARSGDQSTAARMLGELQPAPAGE